MLKVESFSKSFKNTDAVTSLSFTVLPGEVLGLLGPNGSGKTTTLRAVTGLIRPDSGRIFVGQFDVQNSPIEAKRQLGFLSDQPAFFDSLTCWENICLLAKIYSTTNWESRAKALFEKFELADKRDSYPSELSKGLKQRLGLIGVLLHNPKLLLLDEPMNGLDPRIIRILNDTIKEEAKRGTAIILSSHLLSYLEEVCTKVLVLDKGQNVLYEKMSEVRSRFPKGDSGGTLEAIYLEATKDRGE